MEKLEYLRKYTTNIELVNIDDLSETTKATLPKYWIESLSAEHPESRKDLILQEWSKYNYQFQSTISYLKANLVDVEIIVQSGSYSLLYSVKNKSGNVVFYEGKNPLIKQMPQGIALLWKKIPRSFTEVYDNLHNGWVYFASQANGILPIEDVIILGDLDWGILDELDVTELPFELDNCIGFFNNGMGDYASIDINTQDEKTGFIWWHTKAPKLDIEIWAVIDEWTKIGIER